MHEEAETAVAAPVIAAPAVPSPASELPTLYQYVLRRIEEGSFQKCIHVPYAAFDRAQLEDNIRLLWKHRIAVAENNKNVCVYRPKHSSASAKRAYRAKHARIHTDRLEFLRRVEAGTRARVTAALAANAANYNYGFRVGLFVGVAMGFASSLMVRYWGAGGR